jgi:hypothetical protein
MSIRTEDSHPRSIAKAVSWRITGSVDTNSPGRLPSQKWPQRRCCIISMKELGLLFAGISAGNLPMDRIDTVS